MTRPGSSTIVCGIIGLWIGSVYSAMSRSFWTLRAGSERKGHFFFQAEDGIRDGRVTGVQTCALPISSGSLLSEACLYSTDWFWSPSFLKKKYRPPRPPPPPPPPLPPRRPPPRIPPPIPSPYRVPPPRAAARGLRGGGGFRLRSPRPLPPPSR